MSFFKLQCLITSYCTFCVGFGLDFFSEFELSSLFLFSAMYYEFGWIKKCPEDPSVTVHA